MIIKLNNNRSADFIDVTFHNVDGGGSITQSHPVCYVVDGNSVTGGHAMYPATINFPGFTGLSLDQVAINGWGRARAYGTNASVWISNETTSITITGGDVLQLVTGVGVGMSSVGGFTLNIFNEIGRAHV